MLLVFFTGNCQFVTLGKRKWILIHRFEFFWLFRAWECCFKKHDSNYDDVTKSGYFRPRVFSNKVYDVIISVYNVINKRYHVTKIILEILPMFGNYSIAKRKFIVTSILKEFEPKNLFFGRAVLVSVQLLGTGAIIIFVIFWYFLMFYQIFLSPQVKQSAIISNKHGTYELPHKMSNDLRLRILGN